MLDFFHFRNSKRFFFLISSLFLISPLLVSATIVNNLSVGSQGEEVKELQTSLINMGYLSTTATGYFGQATKNAVVRYQKDNNISTSGYVGPVTRASLQTTNTTLISQENREIPRKLFITIVGVGTVTSPFGVNCGAGTCTSDYPRTFPGMSVTLTASPAPGQKFSGWSDACTGMSPSCTIVMNMSKKVTATFTGMDIPASCGSAHGTTVSAQPTSNLCGNGSTPSTVTDTGTSWSWTCSGNSGNSFVSCSANKATQPPSPKCGSANGAPSSSAPNANLCSTGTSGDVTLSSSLWVWSCLGAQADEKVSCSAPVVISTPSLSTRIKAAQTTANNTDINSSCGALNQNASGSNNGFYWEIGDQNGIITDTTTGLTAAGSVYPKTATSPTYTRTVPLLIASASKWVYSTYVAEKKAVMGTNGLFEMPKQYVPFLNFTSGYTNMIVASCPSAETPTVKDCMNKSNGSVTNGTINPRDVGYFAYNGGHMQVFGGGGDPMIGDANGDAMSTSRVFGNDITNTFKSRGVKAEISFTSPMPAGGGFVSAQNYALLLQGIIRKDSPLAMKSLLNPASSNPYAVCTSTTDPKCVDASGKRLSHGTPVPSSLSWHYGIGHWIESDPVTGDGAYSSAGAFGFYPWIDATKTYYGILARQDNGPGQQGFRSAVCGANIRKAFMTGQPQN